MTEGSGACTGSTLVFARYLRERGIDVIWAYREDRSTVPDWATAVRAGSARHRWLAARSRWWITDGLPLRVSGPDTVGRPLERGRDTRVLAFVEPSVEKVGADVVDWPLMTPRQQRLAQERSGSSVDMVAAASVRAAEALGLTAPVVEESPLAERVPGRELARRRLGLAVDAPVVAIASVRGQAEEIARGLAGLSGVAVVIAGDAGDADDVVGACDVLVTDTSPAAAVAARLGRPVIVYAPDLRDLLSRGPGLYLPWQRALPGPHARTAQELRDAITGLRDAAWAVPDDCASGHAALAALAGTRVAGSCEALTSVLQGAR